MPNALNITVCIALSIACGILMSALVSRIEAQKAESYSKKLPYDAWPRYRTALMCVAFAACSLLCVTAFDTLQAVVASALLFVGVSCVVIDVDMRIIPNKLVAALAVLSIALRASCGLESLLYGLAVAFIAFVFLLLTVLISGAVKGKPGMGAGDFKLLVVACLATGWPGVFFMVIGYSIVVLAMSLYQVLYLRLGLKSMFPMAPAIVTGLVCGVIYPLVPGVSSLVPL